MSPPNTNIKTYSLTNDILGKMDDLMKWLHVPSKSGLLAQLITEKHRSISQQREDLETTQ